MSTRKRQSLKIKDKLEIIRRINDGEQRSKLSREYNVLASTITYVYNQRETYYEKVNGHDNLNMKRIKKCKNEQVNNAVLIFIQQARGLQIPLSGDLVRAKAQFYAQKLSVQNFNASVGWLTKLKIRHGISFKQICGESASVNEVDANIWKNSLREKILKYNPVDIYNADETGLFFKCMPDKTLAFKDDKCYGGRHSKERVTVLLCSNWTGSEKLTPIVIGKSRRPRCFKNVKSLPLSYKFNKKAWMTSDIFESWLKELDEKFSSENRKILLFIDNCTAHPKYAINNLKSVEVLYFPPNMTSKIQPLDMGVIKNFKHHYRKRMVSRRLMELECNLSFSEITLLDAINEISDVWINCVTPKTIYNSFCCAGFEAGWYKDGVLPFETVDEDISNDKQNDATLNIWDRLQRFLIVSGSFSKYENTITYYFR